MLNFAESAPPVRLKVSVWAGSSSSEASTSVTAVWFSFTEMAAVAPPPLEEIAGLSFTSATVTVMVCTSVSVPVPSSVTVTSTIYVLSVPSSVGLS